MKKNINKINQSGRSMVEMLGVLAIIGVLSVGGIAGYTTAMNKHRANEILNAASVRAMVVSTQIQNGSTSPTLAEFTDNIVSGATFGTDVKNTASTGAWTKGTDNQFSLTLSGVDKAVCDQMKAVVSADSNNPKISDDDTCSTLTYNNDLGSGTSGDSESGEIPEDSGASCSINHLEDCEGISQEDCKSPLVWLGLPAEIVQEKYQCIPKECKNYGGEVHLSACRQYKAYFDEHPEYETLECASCMQDYSFGLSYCQNVLNTCIGVVGPTSGKDPSECTIDNLSACKGLTEGDCKSPLYWIGVEMLPLDDQCIPKECKDLEYISVSGCQGVKDLLDSHPGLKTLECAYCIYNQGQGPMSESDVLSYCKEGPSAFKCSADATY